MRTWIVNSETSCVAANGVDWLDALAASLAHFRIAPGNLSRLRSARNADGSVEIHDPGSGLRLQIAELDGLRPGVASFRPGPMPPMPVGAEEAPRSDGAEALFDRCAVISAARDIRGAARSALDVTREFVSAESGAILLTTPSGTHLQIVAAFGPKADRVVDTGIPVGSGIAGFISDFQTGTIIRDVRKDARFEQSVDRASGYYTGSLLAVPLAAASGPCFGCLELLNSPTAFRPRDLQVSQVIATALASWYVAAGA